jgi:hypothetical protein
MTEQMHSLAIAEAETVSAAPEPGAVGVFGRAVRRSASAWWEGWVRYAVSAYPWK